MGRKLQHYETVSQARKAFLAEYRKSGDVRLAAKRARVSKTWLYEQKRTRPKFAKRWSEAYDTYLQAAPERERAKMHELNPGNPKYWTSGQLIQALAHMRRRLGHWP